MTALSPELKNGLQLFSRFFDLIHQPITIINKEGKFIYYNNESAEIDSYRDQPALGKHMLEVYTRLNEEKSTMLDALKNGVEYVGNYQVYYNFNGQAVDYQHTTVPLYGSDGQIEGVIEIGRDLSHVRHLQQQVVELNQLLYSDSAQDMHAIVSHSQSMQQLIHKAKKMARNDAPVVIVGETGTGKELFAHLVHQSSPRAAQPFIALNCGALPLPLIESSLFGTVKGAFTGAENRKGYLEIADGGTLFLDEMQAMPLEMQSKLLRFLQDKTFWKLGGSQEQRSNVRIIAALNESPTRLVQEKRLRADLYYRLCVGILSIPPLRARLDDIEPMALHFIEKHSAMVGQRIHGISDASLAQLSAKAWPGNVRMLENVIVRSMMLQEHGGVLDSIASDEDLFDSQSLPLTVAHPAPPAVLTAGSLTEQVEQLERALIVQALNHAGGCVSAAALELNISRTTLHSKIKKYKIQLGVLEG
jgi:arginine utilization regulatory protein